MVPCSFRVTTTFSLRAATRNWVRRVPAMSNIPQMSGMSSPPFDLCYGTHLSPFFLNIDFARSKEGVF